MPAGMQLSDAVGRVFFDTTHYTGKILGHRTFTAPQNTRLVISFPKQSKMRLFAVGFNYSNYGLSVLTRDCGRVGEIWIDTVQLRVGANVTPFSGSFSVIYGVA